MTTDPLPRVRNRSRELDIVLWGATGYTGQLVADYLARNYLGGESGLRLALAGRNEEKVRRVAADIGHPELPVLVGDSFDVASLDAMASRAEVVISTVGPYAKYGAELVGACARNGTDYCDLTGETQFVRAMIDQYEAEAKRTGARIVHCCGYDSIPSDLGTLMVQSAFEERYGRYANTVKMAAVDMRGAFSGGTIASMMNIVDELKTNPGLRKVLGNPYALNPEGVRGPDKGDQTGARYDEDLGFWTAPFIMAAINTRVVRRSHALMGLPWGEDFRYSEVMGTGKGPNGLWRAVSVAGGMIAFMGSLAIPFTRPFVEKKLPAPGEGPSAEARAKGRFKTLLVAIGNGQQLRGVVSDDRDPGYGSTAVMLSESALCLALQGKDLDAAGGILTPATAMGHTLIERLRAAGLTFSIEG
jgi:short subunit dehydrogenase-like uncharacterized protein